MTEKEPKASNGTHRTTKNPSDEDTWRAAAEVPAHWQEVADKKLSYGERKQIIRRALRQRLFSDEENRRQELLEQRAEAVEERDNKKQLRDELNDEIEGLASQISDIDNKLHQLEMEQQEVEDRIEEFVVEEVAPSSITLDSENLAVQNLANELDMMVEEVVEKARRKAEELEVDV